MNSENNLDVVRSWKGILNDIQLSISEANFKTWFSDLALKEVINNNTAIIAVPTEFNKKWILEKFNSTILKSIQTIIPDIRKIDYIIEKINPDDTLLVGKKVVRKKLTSLKNDSSKLKSITLDLQSQNLKTNLNPKYKFNNFVVGSFNEVGYAASQAVVNREEVVYNPLLIYGSTGFGKTHLIQAVGNELLKRNPEKKVYYITSEKFYMDVIDFIGLKSNKTNNFKKKYREYDVFIMDDIQFLTKKERTQEELFHLFNFLHNEDKQIILSSDKHPSQIADLEDRLKSRFCAGMTIDIQSPDYESRIEILKKKALLNNYEIDNESIEYIATKVNGNIRELEGVLNNIFIQIEIKKRNLNLHEVKDIVKNSYKKKSPIDYKKLVEIVCEHYSINKEDIYKKVRKKEIVGPRQMIMYILREDFGHSYPSIGEKMGGRDHTTVMHSCEKIKKGIAAKTKIVDELEEIRNKIQ